MKNKKGIEIQIQGKEFWIFEESLKKIYAFLELEEKRYMKYLNIKEWEYRLKNKDLPNEDEGAE